MRYTNLLLPLPLLRYILQLVCGGVCVCCRLQLATSAFFGPCDSLSSSLICRTYASRVDAWTENILMCRVVAWPALSCTVQLVVECIAWLASRHTDKLNCNNVTDLSSLWSHKCSELNAVTRLVCTLIVVYL